ncbi:MAG: hypothetical protein PHU95_00740 [Candidatus Thermoplasmatota archaeon]|nr:hypothetical protein [Candidatus Thermoplasmatota archaeon]
MTTVSDEDKERALSFLDREIKKLGGREPTIVTLSGESPTAITPSELKRRIEEGDIDDQVAEHIRVLSNYVKEEEQ